MLITEALIFKWYSEDQNRLLPFNSIKGEGKTPEEIVVEKIFTTNTTVRLLLHREIFTEKELRLISCDLAELSMPIWREACPADDRPDMCLKTARLYACGLCSRLEFVKASMAGWKAALLEYQRSVLNLGVVATPEEFAVRAAVATTDDDAERAARLSSLNSIRATSFESNIAQGWLAQLEIVKAALFSRDEGDS